VSVGEARAIRDVLYNSLLEIKQVTFWNQKIVLTTASDDIMWIWGQNYANELGS